MARRARFAIGGIPQHVLQRGNNRQATFHQEADYTAYLEYLGDAAGRHRCVVHSYVLMTNHVHLLVTPLLPDAVSLMMQDLGRRYVYYVNSRYSRSGTL